MSIFRLLLLFAFALSSFSLFAQEEEIFDINFEFQAYPTGLIPGIRFEKGFNESNALHLRLGYNWIRHRDLGVHEDETGDGFGFTLGYKKYFGNNFTGFHSNVKCDIWWNELDWKDGIDTPMMISGTTKITVAQPTFEIGYLFALQNDWICSPTVGFGYEVNFKTKGEPVGEGAILLVGFTLGKRVY